jgi:HNH endonuclease
MRKNSHIEPIWLKATKIKRRQWRQAVLKRDGYKCMKCKRKRGGGKLEAHHIKKWSTHIHLRYEVSNGIALCKQCHKQINNHEVLYERLCYTLLADANQLYMFHKRLLEECDPYEEGTNKISNRS